MTDPVDTFRRIVWLLTKWFLWAILGIITLALVGGGIAFAYNWYTYDRHAERVEFMVSADRTKCTDDKWPIYVLIGNTSSKTLVHASFRLGARYKGRSTDLVDYGIFEDDHISEPNKGFANCWAIPKLKEAVVDPRSLEWSIEYKHLRFRD